MNGAKTVDEPFYIRQTAEWKHVKDPASALTWLKGVMKEAKAEGGNYPRFSWRDGPDAVLLFECWKGRPDDQGGQRWSME